MSAQTSDSKKKGKTDVAGRQKQNELKAVFSLAFLSTQCFSLLPASLSSQSQRHLWFRVLSCCSQQSLDLFLLVIIIYCEPSPVVSGKDKEGVHLTLVLHVLCLIRVTMMYDSWRLITKQRSGCPSSSYHSPSLTSGQSHILKRHLNSQASMTTSLETSIITTKLVGYKKPQRQQQREWITLRNPCLWPDNQRDMTVQREMMMIPYVDMTGNSFGLMIEMSTSSWLWVIFSVSYVTVFTTESMMRMENTEQVVN